MGLGSHERRPVSALLGRPDNQFGMVMDLSIHFCVDGEQLVSHALTYNTEEFCWEVRFIGGEETFTYRNGQLFNDKGEPTMVVSSWVDLASQNKQMLDSLARHALSDYDVTTVLAPMRVLNEAELSVARQDAKGMGQGERIWS